MIQANEVRRGNYIEFEGNYYKIETIAEIYPVLDNAAFGIGIVDWNNINGIPLSEELLLKCEGIEKLAGNYFINVKGFEICFYKDGENLGCTLENIGIDISYLHQLQNLIWCLTNRELEIKL
jgi:hypothetical protein